MHACVCVAACQGHEVDWILRVLLAGILPICNRTFTFRHPDDFLRDFEVRAGYRDRGGGEACARSCAQALASGASTVPPFPFVLMVRVCTLRAQYTHTHGGMHACVHARHPDHGDGVSSGSVSDSRCRARAPCTCGACSSSRAMRSHPQGSRAYCFFAAVYMSRRATLIHISDEDAATPLPGAAAWAALEVHM